MTELQEALARADKAHVVCLQALAKIKNLEERVVQAESRTFIAHSALMESYKAIKDRTHIDVDVSAQTHKPNRIILTGQYRNRDYVEIFTTNDHEMENFIHQLRHMRKHGRLHSVDAPNGLNKYIADKSRP